MWAKIVLFVVFLLQTLQKENISFSGLASAIFFFDELMKLWRENRYEKIFKKYWENVISTIFQPCSLCIGKVFSNMEKTISEIPKSLDTIIKFSLFSTIHLVEIG